MVPDAWPPQPDVFREAQSRVLGWESVGAVLRALEEKRAGTQSRWNSDHEWTVARIHAEWHGRRHPEDGDLAFARAVLAEPH